MTVWSVLAGFVRRPYHTLVCQWHWKAAVLSALSRGLIFFVVNLPAGRDAAVQAFITELLYRSTTAGFYGAMTQAFRHASPPLLAATTVMILLPTVSHSIEGLVHWLRGTPNLAVSLAASVAFTVVSTAFNLFAMRRGALIVGSGRDSLGRDLARMPELLLAFAIEAARGVKRGAGRYLERSSVS